MKEHAQTKKNKATKGLQNQTFKNTGRKQKKQKTHKKKKTVKRDAGPIQTRDTCGWLWAAIIVLLFLFFFAFVLGFLMVLVLHRLLFLFFGFFAVACKQHLAPTCHERGVHERKLH